MWLAMFITGLFRTHYGSESQFTIHIFMYGCPAVSASLAFQINSHATVAVNAIVAMVDFHYLRQDLCFFSIIIRLPVFPVVVVCVWTDFEPAKQPA